MMTQSRFLRVVSPSLFIVLGFACAVMGQTETATISGLVTDRTGAAVARAEVRLQSVERGTVTSTTTNDAGIYVFPSVHPGQYQVSVQKQGFKQIDLLGLIVNVQDHIEQNFRLDVGSVSESVTVEGGAPLINTTDAAVSTVVDRQFAENLPMNGRSFQTLIQLTPGVVLVPSNGSDSGQFTVNGQRADSNYWMVDGVSANIGTGIPGNLEGSPGNGLAGTLGSFSAVGGTNSLVSVDAMQEFRIQTSTYAPEFGRTPGGQISIVTRSGTNQFHGTAFDYLRNDALDANDWFANFAGLPKPQERQNDFGGTFGGPIVKDKTFFFFSYEGLRLRLPQTTLTTVPDVAARQNAVPAMQPFLNAYPLPNGADNPATGVAQFNASYSNPATLDAYSLRVDHKLSNNWNLFARYSYSPSEFVDRGGSAGLGALSVLQPFRITTQTATVGATWIITPAITDDLRLNYSRTNGSSQYLMDNFEGAVPLGSLPFPSPFTSQNGLLNFFIFPLLHSHIFDGEFEHNRQQQFNLVDSLSVQTGRHTLKFGIDFRRLSPLSENSPYLQAAAFRSVPLSENGNAAVHVISAQLASTLLLRNLSVYGQDTWRVLPRLTVTFGLRWDIDFVPQSLSGPDLSAATGFNLNDFSNLALAPPGTAPYKTTYANFAPRVGVAYQLAQAQDWQTVLRGGFGVFYDLASSQVGNSIAYGNYPFGASRFSPGGTFPLSAAAAAPPPIVAPSASNSQILFAFDPSLKLPYTLEWNVALEQGLGKQQSVSASYIGAAGKRLLQTASVLSPNANLELAQLVSNVGTSDYNALQLQFQRRLSHGLQALASYTWSHSIDTGSAGSLGVGSNAFSPSAIGGSNRAASDFDIRHAFSVGTTYDVPTPKANRFASAILGGWSLQNVIQVRSAPPVSILDQDFIQFNAGFGGSIRPDLVPGQPVYVFGSQCASVFQAAGELGPGQLCPGGKGFNPSAFVGPPTDPVTGNPVRQGNVPRNFVRGFGASQWDFAVHRDFPIHESLKLQFRAEIFNVLNHPNFGQPSGCFGASCSNPFGLSTQMLGQSLNGGNLGGGAFNPLYQIGGPRSIQFALKLIF